MGDFVAKTVTKSAERTLTTPIDTMANFVALVSDIITTNHLGYVSYTSGGQTVAGVMRGTEYYSGKVMYENGFNKKAEPSPSRIRR